LVRARNFKTQDLCAQGVEDGDSAKVGSVFHAVEVAEKAVVHALQDEVDNLFDDKNHAEIRTVSISSASIAQSSPRGKKQPPRTSKDTRNNDKNRFGWGLDRSSGF
jgi:hypothetical protein